MSVADIMLLIDQATHPREMPAQAAIDFLQEIAAELQGRIEALENESANAPGE